MIGMGVETIDMDETIVTVEGATTGGMMDMGGIDTMVVRMVAQTAGSEMDDTMDHHLTATV